MHSQCPRARCSPPKGTGVVALWICRTYANFASSVSLTPPFIIQNGVLERVTPCTVSKNVVSQTCFKLETELEESGLRRCIARSTARLDAVEPERVKPEGQQ